VAPTVLPGLENGGWFNPYPQPGYPQSGPQAGLQPPAPIPTNRYGQPSYPPNYQPGYQQGYQQSAQNRQSDDGPLEFLQKLFGR
jgi:hypothetical protein